jgi:hypothetical protein
MFLALLLLCASVCSASEPPEAIVGSAWQRLSDPLDAFEYALQQPIVPDVRPDDESKGTIFIGLAAFREPRCGRTLYHAFKQAKHPERVFVGVVDQLAAGVDSFSCIDDYCRLATQNLTAGLPCPFRAHIRVDVREARQSRGPTLARHYQQKLLQDERFCLQLDSHSLFGEQWDVLMIRDWLATRNEFAVLSTYIANIDQIDKQSDDVNVGQVVPHICKTQPGGHGMVRNQQATAARSLARPKLNTLWGAGLSFSKCHADVVVPYDPNLDHVFDGEEYTRALRLYTWGYDLYTPHRNRVFHDYSPVHHRWSEHDGGGNVTSAIARLRALTLTPGDQDPAFDRFGLYGLGRCRSYEQATAFMGVDPRIGTHSTGAQCGDLQRVPVSVSRDCDARALYDAFLAAMGRRPLQASAAPVAPVAMATATADVTAQQSPRRRHWYARVSVAVVLSLQFLFVLAVLFMARASLVKPRVRSALGVRERSV